MANMFEKFNKTMGVDKSRIDAQQTETAVAFGNYYADLSGNPKRTDIAMQMSGGRHAVSDVVLNQYSIAGQEVSDEVRGMMDELDTLAITSQSIANMDNETRVNLIARGNHGVDPTRLLQKEAEIVSRIADATRDVVTEQKQLDRILKRQSVVTGQQGIEENDIKLRALKLTEEQVAEQERYSDILQDFTATQLQEFYNGQGIEGVPRIALANEMAVRSKLEFETKANIDAMSNKNVGLFGFGKGSGSSASKGKSGPQAMLNDMSTALSAQVSLPQLEGLMVKAFEDAQANEVPLTTIDIPALGSFPVAVVEMAITKQLERKEKLGDAQANRFTTQAKALTNRYATAQAAFGEKLTSLGIDINSPNSIIGQQTFVLQDNYREALNTGDIEGAKLALTSLEKLQETVIDDLVEGDHIPKDRKPLLRELTATGKPRSVAGVRDYLADTVGTELSFATKNNPPFNELANYTNLIVSNAEVAFESNEPEVDADGRRSANQTIAALSGNNKVNEFGDVERKTILEDNFDSGIGSQVLVNATADLLVSDTLYNALTEEIDARTGEGSERDAVALRQAEVIAQVRKGIFGENHAARKIVGNSENFKLSVDSPFSAINNNGEVETLTQADGNLVIQRNVDKKALFSVLPLLSRKMREEGIELNLGNEIINRLTNDRAAYIEMIKPRNPEQKALLGSVSSQYTYNSYTDSEQIMGNIVDTVLTDIKLNVASPTDTLNLQNATFLNMSHAERQEWARNRAQQIVANPSEANFIVGENETPMLGSALRQAQIELQDILRGEGETNDDFDAGKAVDQLFGITN